MKLFATVILAALCAPATLFAQDSTTSAKPPSFIVGASIGLSRYHHGSSTIVTMPSTGLFARHYLGKHLALEYGLKFSSFRSRLGYSIPGTTMQAKILAAPIHLQYHLLKRESPIRPYFGFGIALTRNFYDYTSDGTGNLPKSEHHYYNDGYFQFTQGLTWQLTNQWQLNQAVYYQHHRPGNFGGEIGLGYTIR
jgi:hypothetical protein